MNASRRTPTAAVASATERQRARAAEIEAALERARRGAAQLESPKRDSRGAADDGAGAAQEIRIVARGSTPPNLNDLPRRVQKGLGEPAVGGPEAPATAARVNPRSRDVARQREQEPVVGGARPASRGRPTGERPSRERPSGERPSRERPSGESRSAEGPAAEATSRRRDAQQRAGEDRSPGRTARRPAPRSRVASDAAFADTGGIQLPGLIAPVAQRGPRSGAEGPAESGRERPTPRGRPDPAVRGPSPARPPTRAPRAPRSTSGSPVGMRPVDTTGQTAVVVGDTAPRSPAAGSAGQSQPPRPSRPAPVRRRRPQMILAVCWVVVTACVTLIGGPPLAGWMALACGAAAAQAAGSAHTARDSQPVLAALGAATISVAAAFGWAEACTAAAAMIVVIPLGHRIRGGTATSGMINTTASGVAFGLVGASVVLIRAEDPMLALLLWLFVWMHDSAAFVLGSERPAVVGAIAGVGALAPVALLANVVAPFHGSEAWILAGAATVASALGVWLTRLAMLPTAELRRTKLVPPAVGRLDSLLLTAPAWIALIHWVL